MKKRLLIFIYFPKDFFIVCPSGSNVDRSVKDLQRCTASLTRYRMVVKEEMDSSVKRMKKTFAELQSWYVMLGFFLFFVFYKL